MTLGIMTLSIPTDSILTQLQHLELWLLHTLCTASVIMRNVIMLIVIFVHYVFLIVIMGSVIMLSVMALFSTLGGTLVAQPRSTNEYLFSPFQQVVVICWTGWWQLSQETITEGEEESYNADCHFCPLVVPNCHYGQCHYDKCHGTFFLGQEALWLPSCIPPANIYFPLSNNWLSFARLGDDS
jgi:hypothetical protein